MIRRIERGDRESVLDVLRAADSFSAAELTVAQELIDTVLFQPIQKDYFAFVEVLEPHGEQPVRGMLVVGPTPATEGTWHLYWIAVHPVYHGTGVAQALGNYAEVFVRDRGGYWLLAETSNQVSCQRARGYYCKQGYVQLAQIPDYYKLSDDLVIYGKRLDCC
jgi:ribosomal protein S18 acetylase RimI-like enzyme